MSAPSAPDLLPPPLAALGQAMAASEHWFARVREARRAHVNHEGGDVGSHGHSSLVLRHVANYLGAVEVAEAAGVTGPVADVGSGVGALGAWAADRLDAALHLVDHDPGIREVAARAVPHATVHAEVAAVPCEVGLVTAMEVIEHIAGGQQEAFVASLVGLVAPGGLIVFSTPDESGYAGGWSGYAPHIGPLDFDGLERLLARTTGWPTAVWRLEGGPFDLGPVARVAEPVLNRAWGGFNRRAPGVADAMARLAARLGEALPERTQDIPVVTATADRDGAGTGLLGVVRRPMA